MFLFRNISAVVFFEPSIPEDVLLSRKLQISLKDVRIALR